MDIEFLISRIHEEWSTQRDPSQAVRPRPQSPPREESSAARGDSWSACSVFAAGDERVLKRFGISYGRRRGCVVDAFVVAECCCGGLQLSGRRGPGRSRGGGLGGLDRPLPHLAIDAERGRGATDWPATPASSDAAEG